MRSAFRSRIATAASPTPGTPAGQLADLRAIAERATARPFLLSDCEGVLKVWAQSALEHVTRNADGEITGWSEPGSFTACDLVAEAELDMGTWDPGEDMDDDQRRTDISDLVDARAALPAVLAEVKRLRGALGEATDYVAELEAEVGRWSARVAELEATPTAPATTTAESDAPRG